MALAMPAADEPLEGLTLEQYAGITAALAEGFALPAVLANEGLEPAAWPGADAAWKTRLAEDGAEGALFAAYREKRGLAEDHLSRKVDPIDSDLGAWMSFLRAWGDHPSPFDLLGGAGLGMNDMARLQRRWAQRLAQDAALQKQAADLAKKGPGPLPAIKVQAGALQPFPWSKGTKAKPAEATPPTPAAGPMGGLSVLDLSFYRYVAAKAHLAEHPGDEEHVRVKMALPDFAKIDAAWQLRLQSDPALARDYRQLLDHERGKIRNAAKRGASAPVAAAPPKVEAPPPSRNPLAGTALTVDVPRGPVLPFAADAPPASTAAPPSAAAKPAAETPPPSRAPLSGTALAVDVPRGPALPFAGEPEKKAKRLGEMSMGLRIPEHLRNRAEPPASPATPELTLEQHASLCCELAAAPEQSAETLLRYRLSAAQKEQLDRHFAERFAREPGLREAWDRAHAAYREWWLAQRRGGA
jgi:hypothetical protein